GEFDLASDFIDGLADGRSEVAAAHAVLDGDVAGVAFAINGGGAIVEGDVAQLGEGDALAGGREDADIFDVLDCLAELGQVADGKIVALLEDQDLRESLSTDGGFAGDLNIADVDAEAIGPGAIDV